MTAHSTSFLLTLSRPGLQYRVALGKHNLLETEDGSAFVGAADIIVHENWDPALIQ